MKTWIAENPTLPFESPPLSPKGKPSPLDRRYQAMTAAERAANDLWKIKYEAHILRFLEIAGPSTAENIRLAYLADKRNPVTKNEQASGAIFARLKRVGLIVDIGFEKSKTYGNILVIYKRTELERWD